MIEQPRRLTRDQVLFAIHHANDKASVREAARLTRLWLADNPDDIEITQLSSSLTVTATALLSDTTPPYESTAPAAATPPAQPPAANVGAAAPTHQAGADWLTVAEAAQRLGISVRAVQKRCHNGTLPARRVETVQGTKWEIDGRALPQNKTRPSELDALNGREPDAPYIANGREQAALQAQNEANSDTSKDAASSSIGHVQGREPDAATGEQIEALRNEVHQLRAFIAGGAMQALQERLAALPDADAVRAIVVENQAQIVSTAVAEAVSQVAAVAQENMAQAVEQGIAAATAKDADTPPAATQADVRAVLEEMQKLRDDNARLSGELAALREDREEKKGFFARLFGGG